MNTVCRRCFEVSRPSAGFNFLGSCSLQREEDETLLCSLNHGLQGILFRISLRSLLLYIFLLKEGSSSMMLKSRSLTWPVISAMSYSHSSLHGFICLVQERARVKLSPLAGCIPSPRRHKENRQFPVNTDLITRRFRFMGCQPAKSRAPFRPHFQDLTVI